MTEMSHIKLSLPLLVIFLYIFPSSFGCEFPKTSGLTRLAGEPVELLIPSHSADEKLLN